MTSIVDERATRREREPEPETQLDLEDLVLRRETRRDGITLVVSLVAVAALVAAVVGVGLGARAIDESKRNASTSGAPAEAAVSLREFAIAPSELTLATGGTLRVTNDGVGEHNLAVKGTDLITPTLAAGDTGELSTAGLEPGTYTLYCEIAGHEQAGMHATLHVGTATRTGALAGHADDAGHDMTAAEMDEQMLATTKAYPAKTEGIGAQPLAPRVLADGTKEFELTTKVVQWEVAPGRFAEAWTYNGTVPGPTIQVDPGDKVRVVVRNEMEDSTAIHFHGLITPNAMDGVPGITQDPIEPGETFAYEFTAQTTPAVGMYHSHHDAAKQVPNGLAGAFLVGEQPVPAGVTVTQRHVMMLNDSGTIGFAINGKSFPATAPIVAELGEWIEVQYMNEGEMIHPMHLHGMAQMVIAKDGFPLAQPQLQDTILVAPGERYTVLVHADIAGTWAWHCHVLSHAEDSSGMRGMVTALVVS